MSQALTDAPLTIFGDGEQTRDFVYVHDVVQAYLTAAGLTEGRALPVGVYNVGAGVAVKIVDLASVLLILTGKPSAIIFGCRMEDCEGVDLPVRLFYPSREGDIVHSVADISAIRQNSAWRAETVLTVGMARTIHWYRPVVTGQPD